MKETISIQQEENYHSHRINVFVPQTSGGRSNASIQDKQGAVLKKINLNAGYNAIDISNIPKHNIFIKVETPFETILKELK